MPRLEMILPVLFLLVACSKQSDLGPQVRARVEDRLLLESELRSLQGYSLLPDEELIHRWMNRQILLSRASKDNLLDLKGLSSKMARFSSRLESQLYLDSLTRRYFRPTKSDLLAYYDEHPELFTFRRESARIILVSFIKLEEARAALRQLRTASTRDSVLAFFNYDQLFVGRDQLIPELNEAVFSAQPGSIVGPVSSEFGSHLVFVESRYSQGEKIPFELTLDMVAEHLLQLQIHAIQSSIIDSLSELLDVEVRPR